MLRYEVKLGSESFKQDELKWGEKYLAQDLSFITGVTDPSYHLESYDKLSSSNSIINSESILSLSAYNVTRQGFIIASGKTYDVHSGKTYDYSINSSGTPIYYHCVNVNGKYFYWYSGYTEDNELISGYTLDKVLVLKDGEVIEGELFVDADSAATEISADTIYWIEDGKVVIDGDEYIYDANENNGILKYGEDGVELDASAITRCQSLEYHPYSSSTQYKTVTKFRLDKSDEVSEPFSRITFCKYYYFIKYKNHYCPIKKVVSGDSYNFLCEIPKFVLSGGTSLEPKPYQVYFLNDLGYGNLEASYRETVNSESASSFMVNSENYSEHGVKTLDELKNISSFVYVSGETGGDDVCVTVENDIMSANYGAEIAIYLDNIYSPLNIGERLELVDTSSERYAAPIYNSSGYSGQDESFVLYNGDKYTIKKNICDKVEINTVEYDIDYINGKKEGVDCLVDINGEWVPMMISGVTDGFQLKRYGNIVSGDPTSESTEAFYNINTYDGVVIDGKKYVVYTNKISDEETNEDTLSYADIYLQKKYSFYISDILGNSTYICKPYINATDFTDDFNRYVSEEICNDVVSNQTAFDVQVKNKIFGENPITETLPFRATDEPRSSDDYYNLFNDLRIFVNNGYISVPITLSTRAGGNPLQDNIVERDFFEKESEKVINPIVDMEKDVYVPKYIESDNGKYSGSNTTFKPINQLNLNFHFRTRNLDSWKVNEGYNNAYASGDTDNWFITDFYPYREILDNEETLNSGSTLQKTSDLMGLLYFTNDDIFYQRSKVAKSFARLSFYDSTDPQTQSLLATSCVFVDEHSLFKTFIDNSRKNFYDYGGCKEPEYSASTTDAKADDITVLKKYNKINVMTEFLGSKKDNIDYSATTDSSAITIDESHRISSRLIINNKYETDTSSEGFYLYIFREYSENLHPKPIYMKVEFNHAGIGKQIPFNIPMCWSGNTSGITDDNYNEMYPVSALTLSDSGDVKTLKEGIPLSYVYAQSYIPLYAVYDFKSKEYAYVFDDRYVDVDEDGIVNLNLFEMKIKDEDKFDKDKDQKDITYNRQIRAIIDINTKQFDEEAFN